MIGGGATLLSEILDQTDRVGAKSPIFDWATENAEVENAIRTKLQGWKTQEWKKQEWLENAGVNRMEHQPEIILRKPQVTSLDLSLFL